MSNVLITGAQGFIGNNLCDILPNMVPNLHIFKGTRDTIDLYSVESVHEFICKNNIESVIHCANEGNGRPTDTIDIVYYNLLMVENLIAAMDNNSLLINISSGAEYDRKYSIDNAFEEVSNGYPPSDYYGLSKYIITKLLIPRNATLTFRIFGCFYHNENSDRFIRSNIERYIQGTPMIIRQDLYMDFFYLEDLASLIAYALNKHGKYCKELFRRNFNLVYDTHQKLSDIANIINTLSADKKVDIIIENPEIGKNYTGRSKNMEFANRFIKFKGLNNGIHECYEKLISHI